MIPKSQLYKLIFDKEISMQTLGHHKNLYRQQVIQFQIHFTCPSMLLIQSKLR